MATKFLTSTGSNTDLSDGTANIFINSLSCSTLSASLPIKTNGVKSLISSKLEINDVNGLQAALDDFSQVNLTSSGGMESLINDGVGPDMSLKGLSSGDNIIISSDATNIIINAVVTNVTLESGLSGQGKSLVKEGVGPFLSIRDLTAGQSILLSEGADEVTITYDDTRLNIVEVKTQMISSPNIGTTAVNGIFNVVGEGLLNCSTIDTGVINVNNINTSSNITTAQLITTTLNTDTVVVNNQLTTGLLNGTIINGTNINSELLISTEISSPLINSQQVTTNDLNSNNINCNSIITLSINTDSLTSFNNEIDVTKTIDMNGFSILNCQNINNIRPSGGVYSQSIITPIVGVQNNLNLIGLGLQFGTTTIPANNFFSGDTFSIKIGGSITCSINDVFSISLNAGLSVFSLFNISIDTALTNAFWEIEVEFMIRTVGGAGVASIVTNGNFMFINANTFCKGVGNNTLENINFNTTIDNSLRIDYTTLENTISITPTQISITKLF